MQLQPMNIRKTRNSQVLVTSMNVDSFLSSAVRLFEQIYAGGQQWMKTWTCKAGIRLSKSDDTLTSKINLSAMCLVEKQ